MEEVRNTAGTGPAPTAYLRRLSLLSGCPDSQLAALAPYTDIISCRRHQEIHREGDPARHLHCVLTGEVGLEKSRGAGREPMRLAIIRPGECFGLGEFMLPTFHTTATALANGRLLRISCADFRKHFLAMASVRDRVLAELSHIAKYLLFAVVAGSGTQMLAFYLQRLCRENARETAGKFHVRTRLRQPEIASLLNMSREHITRLFSHLRKEGVVDFNRGYPIIDKQWLRHAVSDDDLADFIVYRDYPR